LPQNKELKMKLKMAILICTLQALTACTALSEPADNDNNPNTATAISAGNNPNASANSGGPSGKPAVGVPGPIGGAGLAFLAAGGGYLVLRYRKRK
jgi:hypothetical protein